MRGAYLGCKSQGTPPQQKYQPESKAPWKSTCRQLDEVDLARALKL